MEEWKGFSVFIYIFYSFSGCSFDGRFEICSRGLHQQFKWLTSLFQTIGFFPWEYGMRLVLGEIQKPSLPWCRDALFTSIVWEMSIPATHSTQLLHAAESRAYFKHPRGRCAFGVPAHRTHPPGGKGSALDQDWTFFCIWKWFNPPIPPGVARPTITPSSSIFAPAKDKRGQSNFIGWVKQPKNPQNAAL